MHSRRILANLLSFEPIFCRKWLGKCMLLLVEMALPNGALMAYLPSDHCSPLGAFSEVDPLDV